MKNLYFNCPASEASEKDLSDIDNKSCRSSPELCLANKTKMHLKQKKKMNSKLLEYEDVLYFDLQPHPMAYTLESVVMEQKQTVQVSYS